MALALAAAAGVLAWPRAVDVNSGRRIQAVLVDASASVVRTRSNWAEWVRAELRELCADEESAERDVVVVTFAENALTTFGPAPLADLRRELFGRSVSPTTRLVPEVWADAGSDLEAALGVLDAALSGTRLSDLILLGDGSFTGNDPSAKLRALAARGVRVRELRPPPADLCNLGLVEIALPPAPIPGAPLVARVMLSCSGPAPARVRIEARVDRGGGAEVESFELIGAWPGTAGDATFEVPLGLAREGSVDVRASVRALDAGLDPLPEDDSAQASAVVGERPLVCVVGRDPQRVAAAFGLAQLEGLTWRQLDLDSIDLQELGLQLEGADLALCYDIAPAALPESDLRAFVQRGGGLLCAGKLSQLVPGDSGGVLEMLPLVALPKQRAPREVLLLLDGSGSMAGAPFDAVRGAALQLVDSLPAGDRLVVRFFTAAMTAPVVLVDGDERSRSDAARALLSARRPSGSTALLDSLDQLAAERFGLGLHPREQLVLLLSDGRESSETSRTAVRIEALRRAWAQTNTRLIPIAVGERAEASYLQSLASDGVTLRRVGADENLAELVVGEVAGERLLDAPLTLNVLERDAAGVGRATAPVAGLGLERALSARARPAADLIWATAEEGDPLLAVWNVGVGRVAALASVPEPGWAPNWSGRADLFGPLLRHLAVRSAPRGVSLRRRVSGAESRLELRGVGDAWPQAFSATLEGLGGEFLGELEFGLDPARAEPGVRSAFDPPAEAFRLLLPSAIDAPEPGQPQAFVVPPLRRPEFRGLGQRFALPTMPAVVDVARARRQRVPLTALLLLGGAWLAAMLAGVLGSGRAVSLVPRAGPRRSPRAQARSSDRR